MLDVSILSGVGSTKKREKKEEKKKCIIMGYSVDVAIAYFLWAFFGWTGLHLFYVGRDDHMFVYLSTGGGFFLGWLRDFWRLPTYCGLATTTTAADGDELLSEELQIHRIRIKSSPGGRPHWFQPTRFVASAVVAHFYGFIVSSVFDLSFLGDDYALFAYDTLYAVGAATAIWLVGNIGMHSGPFLRALFGAINGVLLVRAVFPLSSPPPSSNTWSEYSLLAYDTLYAVGVATAIWLVGTIGMHSDSFLKALFGALAGVLLVRTVCPLSPPSSSKIWSVSFSFLWFAKYRTWTTIEAHMARRGNGEYGKPTVEPSKRIGTLGRLFRLALAGLLFASMCGSGLYFHVKVTDKVTGETIRLRDSVDNLLRSPLWGEFYITLRDLYRKNPKWDSFFSSVRDSVDLTGENSARRTLGVAQNASMNEIKTAHRSLARELHPDRGGDPDKFIEMQNAFERLEKIMKK